ncbi:MAG: hypothetical protein JWM86_710 [Thermoleophilia bacterium]|nr:hypothetical protein [Thermoleophilia bacterium]
MSFRTRTIIAPIALLVLALAVAACGGDDSSPKAKSKGETAKERRAKERVGYFDQRESKAFNTALTAYNADLEAFTKGVTPCNDRTQKLFDQGKPVAAQAACHIEESTRMVDAVAQLRETFDGFGREYRASCDAQREKFSAFLASYEKAWAKTRSNWQAYAKGDRSHDDEVAPDVKAASTMAGQLNDVQMPAISKACYTKADIQDSADAAATSGDDATADDSSKDEPTG